MVAAAEGEEAGALTLTALAPEGGRVLWRGEVLEARGAPPEAVERAIQRVLIDFPQAAPRPVAYRAIREGLRTGWW